MSHEHYPGIPALVGLKKTLVSAPGHVLIDDYEKNEQEWRERGGHAVLVPGPWNRLRGCPVMDVVREGLNGR